MIRNLFFLTLVCAAYGFEGANESSCSFCVSKIAEWSKSQGNSEEALTKEGGHEESEHERLHRLVTTMLRTNTADKSESIKVWLEHLGHSWMPDGVEETYSDTMRRPVHKKFQKLVTALEAGTPSPRVCGSFNAKGTTAGGDLCTREGNVGEGLGGHMLRRLGLLHGRRLGCWTTEQVGCEEDCGGSNCLPGTTIRACDQVISTHAYTLSRSKVTARSCMAGSITKSSNSPHQRSFYCINGGTIGGTTGDCTCTSCNTGFIGNNCETEATHKTDSRATVAGVTLAFATTRSLFGTYAFQDAFKDGIVEQFDKLRLYEPNSVILGTIVEQPSTGGVIIPFTILTSSFEAAVLASEVVVNQATLTSTVKAQYVVHAQIAESSASPLTAMSVTVELMSSACTSQTGCAVDIVGTCLSSGDGRDETKLACTTASVGYRIVGTGTTATATECTSQTGCKEDSSRCLESGEGRDETKLACLTTWPYYNLKCSAFTNPEGTRLGDDGCKSPGQHISQYTGVSTACTSQTGCKEDDTRFCLASATTTRAPEGTHPYDGTVLDKTKLACKIASAGFHVYGEWDIGIATACTGQTGCAVDTAGTCLPASKYDRAKLACTTASAGFHIVERGEGGTPTACTSQTGCAVDDTRFCLSSGDGRDETKLACTTASAGFHIVGTNATATATACFDFSGEASLESYTCTTCSGSLRWECTSKPPPTCAAGYHTYDPASGTCSACASQTGCAVNIVGTCLSSGDGRDETKLACTTASAGFRIVGTSATATATACTFGASMSACSECNAAGDAGCTTGTCNNGYHTFASGQGCSAAICPTVNYANSDKSAGTGTSVTTGTVAVACDAGYSGSGNAVCTGDAGATTAAFVFTGCEAATCPTVNYANSDKKYSARSAGTGTSTTTGTVAVACDAGYSGSGNAVCTADAGATTAAFVFTGCEAAICPTVNYANSDKSTGTGTSTTTGTVAVTCDAGYSSSGNAVCTADAGATTAAFVFTNCAENKCTCMNGSAAVGGAEGNCLVASENNCDMCDPGYALEGKSCTRGRMCTHKDVTCLNGGAVAGQTGIAPGCFCVCRGGFHGALCEMEIPSQGCVKDACGICGGDSSSCVGFCSKKSPSQCMMESRCSYTSGACAERVPCAGTPKWKCGMLRSDCKWDFRGPNGCTVRHKPTGCLKRKSREMCGRDSFCKWDFSNSACIMKPCHGKNKSNCDDSESCKWTQAKRMCSLK